MLDGALFTLENDTKDRGVQTYRFGSKGYALAFIEEAHERLITAYCPERDLTDSRAMKFYAVLFSVISDFTRYALQDLGRKRYVYEVAMHESDLSTYNEPNGMYKISKKWSQSYYCKDIVKSELTESELADYNRAKRFFDASFHAMSMIEDENKTDYEEMFHAKADMARQIEIAESLVEKAKKHVERLKKAQVELNTFKQSPDEIMF